MKAFDLPWHRTRKQIFKYHVMLNYHLCQTIMWSYKITIFNLFRLLDFECSQYEGLIWLSNYNTSGTAKLVINTMIQKYGHDEGIQYLVDLDKNIHVYTKSGSGPSKNVGTGECVIGVHFPKFETK